MRDIEGIKTPVPIEDGEWWFRGRIIQKQNHYLLAPYISWPDIKESSIGTMTHSTKKEAIAYCKLNPCLNPDRQPKDYL